VMVGLVFGESVRLCVNPCVMWDNNSYSLWNNVLCGTIVSVDTFYLNWDIGYFQRVTLT
jgi:hypothetical protein